MFHLSTQPQLGLPTSTIVLKASIRSVQPISVISSQILQITVLESSLVLTLPRFSSHLKDPHSMQESTKNSRTMTKPNCDAISKVTRNPISPSQKKKTQLSWRCPTKWKTTRLKKKNAIKSYSYFYWYHDHRVRIMQSVKEIHISM